MLSMETSFELSDADGGGTAMKWAADVKIAGPVGSMGQRVLQPIVNQQVSARARPRSTARCRPRSPARA